MRLSLFPAVATFLLAMAAAGAASPPAETSKPTPDELAEARRFVAAKFTRRDNSSGIIAQEGLFSADPPFSFAYNGEPSARFLGNWKVDRKSKALPDHRTVHTVVYTDPAGGLSVRCEAVEYEKYPTIEWTVYLKNEGTADTPIIENVRSLDVCWQQSGDGAFLLHHNIGSPHDGTDYTPLETPLPAGSSKRIAAAGGRSTWTDLSYFNIERSKNDGLIVVVGWPGQWAAEFARDAGKNLAIRAGQELTHFTLHPNEEVRTPLSVLQFWKGGDWIRAQNVWRRWMIDHNVPRPGGRLPAPQVCGYSGRVFSEMERANEENQMQFIDRYVEERIKLDYWWMDAGWFPCDGVGWWKTGTWEVDSKRFPRGLKAVSDHAHEKGIKTIVWFEPERAHPGTWLTETHPEWLHEGKNGGLLDLGNKDAWNWLTNHIDKFLGEQGIDLYRQDFNMDPLGAWRAADAANADRQGIAEIRHVEGLLAYWDELRRRHPDMLIDECASGGKRNDLEMMRRSVPLWRSDFPFGLVENQRMTVGISTWIPYYGTGVFGWETPPYDGKLDSFDSYAFWSKAGPSVLLSSDMRDKKIDYAALRRLVAQWREINSFYSGDFYPLMKANADKDAWIAWQFNDPEKNAGVVQAFRRSECPYESARLQLRGLDPGSRYRLDQFDPPLQFEASGEELLRKGVLISIGQAPGAAVVTYRPL